MTVLAIAVTPNTTGLPGITEFTNIVGAMMTVGALACVLAVILSAGMWALGSHSGNVQLTSRAKTGVVVSAVAALLSGGAALLVTFFTSQALRCDRFSRPVRAAAPVGVAGRRDCLPGRRRARRAGVWVRVGARP